MGDTGGNAEAGTFVYELIDFKWDTVSRGLFSAPEKAHSFARKLLGKDELIHPLWQIVKREVQ